MLISRLAVLAVAVLAVVLAYHKNGTILSLVGYAWAGFGASFGPVILLSLYWKRMNKWGALAGIIGGAATVIVWANVPVLAKNLYEIIPGFLVGSIAIWIVSLLTEAPNRQMNEAFKEYKKID